jgi:hypothetical protein
VTSSAAGAPPAGRSPLPRRPALAGCSAVGRTAGALLRRHWAFGLLLLAGATLRLLVMIGYDPAFWYQGDSQSYLGHAYTLQPGTVRPSGYSLFLHLLLDLRSVRRIIGIQHLLGLGIALAAYVFLHRRGVSRLVAAIAVTPLLLDARTVNLEHFLLAETLFTALVLVGMLALCWRERPGWLGCLVAGAAFGAAAVTRSIGLAALAVPLLYLVLRGVNWRRTVAVVAVVGAILGGYLSWYHQEHGQYSFASYASRFLWARTATFADCGKLDLTAEERLLCPREPLSERMPPDLYLWNGPNSPNGIYPEQRYDAVFGSFARKAILTQPGDYALAIAEDTWLTVRPWPSPSVRTACIASVWTFPAADEKGCQPYLAPKDPAKRRLAGLSGQLNHPLMKPLHWYSGVATMPATLVALCFLLALGLACYRPRRERWRENLDPLVWTGLGLAFIAGSAATSAIDPRYAVPSLPLAVVGAALAWQRFRTVRRPPDQRTPPPTASPTPSPTASPTSSPTASPAAPSGVEPGLKQAEAVGEGRRLDPIGDLQLGDDPRDVHAHRLR